MGTMLQLPAFPRHGILLNPSPSTSPYGHPMSLPGTPHLISSLSSLSSSASSNSPHNFEADHYFLTCSSPARDASAVPRNGSITPTTTGSHSASNTLASRESSSSKRPSGSAPQTRKIRFAPLPEPRREELDLPEVFLDDSMENLNSFPLPSSLETPRQSSHASSSRPNSLLFSGPVDASQPLKDSTTAVLVPPPSEKGWTHVTSTNPIAIAPSSQSQSSASDRYDSDTDLTTPQSPNTGALLSSSSSFIERYPCPQSCPESPIGRRTDLPFGQTGKERRWSTKKLFKPFLGPLSKKDITTEDVLTLGLSQLYRASTRDRDRDDDGSSSGAATPLRSRSKERTESLNGSVCDFGAPLSRSTSDNTGANGKKKKRSSFLSSLTGGSSSSQQDGMWRTQSATADIRRTKSRESTFAAAKEDVKRPRSASTAGAQGQQPRARKQLRMLNGRVYGAKRNNLNGVNLFASARSDPEFVEWGYGGMGSVKTAASVGNTKYSRVQGSAALGHSSDNAGWSNRRGSAGARPNDDDDDGSGMAWLKRRREEREREKKEREEREKAAAESTDDKAAGEEQNEEQPATEVTDSDPSALAQVIEEESGEPTPTPSKELSEDDQHITTAVTVPAPHPSHHSRPSIERVSSSAYKHVHTPERKSTADTVRDEPFAGAEVEAVGEMELEMADEKQDILEGTPVTRERRESQSSGTSDGTEDEEADADADGEDSVREEEDDEDDDEERTRRTAVGAGVEKISRHKSTASVNNVEAG